MFNVLWLLLLSFSGSRAEGIGEWRVVGLAPRTFNPRAVDLDTRLKWLEHQAEFLEGRYPESGLRDVEDTHLARRSIPQRAPFDIAEERRERMRKRAVATVGLSDLYTVSGGLVSDTAYLVTGQVGTPAQSFNLQVDTGSSQLWVGTAGAFAGSSVAKNTFTSSRSSTWKQTSTQLESVTYGSGAVQGIIGQDTVALGGISLPNQSVLAAQAVSSSFVASLIDGLWGFAFSTLSSNSQPTFFENLASSGRLTSPAFSLYLTRAVDNATIGGATETLQEITQGAAQGLTPGGELVLGGFDSNRFVGNLSFAPLISRGYWLVQQDGTYANGQLLPNSRIAAAIDSGTSLTILPTAVASELATALGGQMAALSGTSSLASTFLVVPCSTPSDRLNIAFGFAGQRFTLNMSDLALGPADASGQFCVLGILGRNVPQSSAQPTSYISVIGDTMLKSVYTTYSLEGQGSVGFALAATSSGSTTQSTLDLAASATAAGGNPVATRTPLLPNPSQKSGASLIKCSSTRSLVIILVLTLGTCL